VRGDTHAGFGGRAAETHRGQPPAGRYGPTRRPATGSWYLQPRTLARTRSFCSRGEWPCPSRIAAQEAPPADLDQLTISRVAAGDHHLGAGDRAEHAADDHLDGVAVLDLLEGWIWCRAVALGRGFAWCATPW
jgi:hypothetical protein